MYKELCRKIMSITCIFSRERGEKNLTSVTQNVLNYSVEKSDFDFQNKYFI